MKALIFIFFKYKIYVLSFVCIFLSNLNAQSKFCLRLADSSISLTKQIVQYDPTYFKIPYPNGDVPSNKGVCTDVIIRSYRKLGIDLQKEVHVDMSAHFEQYPKNWGMKSTDRNIDHRRVPNLMVFFKRCGDIKKITQNPSDYLPGDIVCWNLGGGITHIGLISNKKVNSGNRYLVLHNIGSGQVLEDCLFDYKIIGHFVFEKK